MRIYSAEYCQQMIAHYTQVAAQDGRPKGWKETALASIATWEWQLSRALA